MLTIEKECYGTLAYSFPQKEKIVFFDIETTGFSPKTSALYLIGVLYNERGNWHIKQWFADDYTSEKEILTHFFDFLKNYHYLIHYNGLGFDIPFLKEKCSQYEMFAEYEMIDKISQIDIYKRIFPHKKKLKIENIKQKTIESFLHIHREDPYHGRELIKVYRNYLKQKQAKNTLEANALLSPLILHNEEDLSGMLNFSGILHLTDLLDGKMDFSSISMTVDEKKLTVTAILPSSMPCSLSYKGIKDLLTIEENILTLQIFSYQGELKFFYENYKDYYYLPIEDTAIHKSVAAFVDKDYRQKAKRENCYQRKEGIFFPVYHSCSMPLFRTEYKDTISYFLYEENFIPNTEWITDYLHGYFQNHSTLLLES